MNKQKGLSIINLMAVVAIIGILAIIALPIYNQYIERTKVANELPVIGVYKNDIAKCFMKNDSLEVCNAGRKGIHKGLESKGRILSLDVIEGDIYMIVDSENHIEKISPIELKFVVTQDVTPASPALNWDLYCNDYTPDNGALVKECRGLLSGEGDYDVDSNDGDDNRNDSDNNNEEWQSIIPSYTEWQDKGSPNYISEWAEPVSEQTSDFEQERYYEQEQTRTQKIREENQLTNEIRIVDEIEETQTVTRVETREVTVTSDITYGPLYDCSEWDVKPSDSNEEFRDCSQDRIETFTYSVGGSYEVIDVLNKRETRERNIPEYRWGDWSDWVYLDDEAYCRDWHFPGTNADINLDRYYDNETVAAERKCFKVKERERDYFYGDEIIDTEVDREVEYDGMDTKMLSGTKPSVVCVDPVKNSQGFVVDITKYGLNDFTQFIIYGQFIWDGYGLEDFQTRQNISQPYTQNGVFPEESLQRESVWGDFRYYTQSGMFFVEKDVINNNSEKISWMQPVCREYIPNN